MRRPLFLCIALVLSLGLIALAPVATAGPSGVQLGAVPTTADIDTTAFNGYYATQAALSDVAIPSDGKILAFQIRDYVTGIASMTGEITFDVWRPAATAGQLTLVLTSGPIALNDDGTVLTWSTGKRGWAVQKGDYFGVYIASGTASLDVQCSLVGMTECGEVWGGDGPVSHAVGTSYAFLWEGDNPVLGDFSANVAVSFKGKGKPAS